MGGENLGGDFQLWWELQLVYPAFQLAACWVVSKNGNGTMKKGRGKFDEMKI